VIAGNDYLAGYARRWNANVSIVPTTIELDAYRPAVAHRAKDVVTIGWSGSYSTAKYLARVRPILAELARRVPVRFLVVGAEIEPVPGVPTECRPWRAEREVADLREMDVGIMPLPDESWERGKCGLKALQYMALAVPPVVSPVGVNAAIVRDGENGFVAGGDGDWIDRLERLARDPALRQRLGDAALATVRRRYSAEAQAPRVGAILRAAARRHGSGRSDRER
jgi:glycosyltransferase involved in cell wall biosynthesis